ncbi:MAG: LpxI family protein, partial [Phenylobacterium sp.]|nr:LpxI family protein [Phenylobacterium sp.]
EEVAPALRGAAGRLRGVLAKAPKPIQETRVDLPTLGPATVRGAARAGLAGIAAESGRTLVLEREVVIALADELGLFVVGVEGS